MLVNDVMNDVLIQSNGKTIDVLSNADHDRMCLLKLGCTLDKFIYEQAGCRISILVESIALESFDHLSDKQVIQVNKILRNNEIYSIYSCVKGIEKRKPSFRPIRGLPESLR
ncbi:hypothetical protein LCGC14_3064210 [marine sediment metagenome]|uniref:Uncharacterized protein n=1 Tax=marine sediment metagenome TaxID=412755 RepID=A0A0F8YQS1_9ZZZZ